MAGPSAVTMTMLFLAMWTFMLATGIDNWSEAQYQCVYLYKLGSWSNRVVIHNIHLEHDNN